MQNVSLKQSAQKSPQLDKGVFWPAIVIIVSLALPLVLFPDPVRAGVGELLAFITGQLGWLLLLFGFACLLFLAWLAFSRYGDIKLGGADEPPEFSKRSWVAMLFCAGIGIAIVNWAFVEPIYLMNEPAMGIAGGSVQAIEWATMYSQFHWGIIPWAIYSIATVPVAYSLYVRRRPYLRFSSAAKPLLGHHSDGAIGKLIDLIVILSILGGVGTSLGLSIPLVTGLLGTLFELENTAGLNIVVLVIWTGIFSYSAYMGLGKGIKVLSDINISMAFGLLAFVLLVGPTIFIFKLWSNSLGLYLDNFIHIALWTDPVTDSGFTEKWTVFYWAWWIAYAPMMALFIARISRGRTIREVILNEVLWGSAGCMAFFAIWGGYSVYLETQALVNVSEILMREGTAGAVIAVMQSLPGGWLLLAVFTLLCFIFLATTLDSAAYTLASVSTRNLSGYQEPARWNRLLWAFLIAIVGVALLMVGGLDIVQVSTLLFSLPMMVVLIVLCWALYKQLKQDFPELSQRPVIVMQEKRLPMEAAEVDCEPEDVMPPVSQGLTT